MRRRLTEVQYLLIVLALLVISYGRPVFPQEAASASGTLIASIASFVVVGGFLVWFLVRILRQSARKGPMKDNKLGVYVSTTAGKRPFGLVLVVVYTLISGVIGLIITLTRSELYAAGATTIGTLLVAVLLLVVVYGLWTTRKWGLKLARGVYLVSIVLGIASLSTARISTSTDLFSAVTVALDILVTIYLFRPQTKALFQ